MSRRIRIVGGSLVSHVHSAFFLVFGSKIAMNIEFANHPGDVAFVEMLASSIFTDGT
jgi:hypothetical protein